MAEPFAEAWLCAKVPIVTPLTLYTRYGDYLGRFFTWAAFSMLILGAVSYILSKYLPLRRLLQKQKQ
jgi:apolipoprotein N-acyltransferase